MIMLYYTTQNIYDRLRAAISTNRRVTQLVVRPSISVVRNPFDPRATNIGSMRCRPDRRGHRADRCLGSIGIRAVMNHRQDRNPPGGSSPPTPLATADVTLRFPESNALLFVHMLGRYSFRYGTKFTGGLGGPWDALAVHEEPLFQGEAHDAPDHAGRALVSSRARAHAQSVRDGQWHRPRPRGRVDVRGERRHRGHHRSGLAIDGAGRPIVVEQSTTKTLPDVSEDELYLFVQYDEVGVEKVPVPDTDGVVEDDAVPNCRSLPTAGPRSTTERSRSTRRRCSHWRT